jgi:D-alanine-D-alanine ligase
MFMKKNIAIVAGGYSGESAVSAKSAEVVEKYIDKNLYNITKVWIDKSSWKILDGGKEEIFIDKNDFSYHKNGEKHSFDGVFIIIHGTPGEDGKLQGYFDMIGMPYTGCNALVSSILFHKHSMNKIIKDLGCAKIAKSVRVMDALPQTIQDIKEQLQAPCFVKPMKGGSSIGMTKLNDFENLEEAILIALKEDDEVLVEEFINGTEVTCGVFRHKEKKIVLPLTEIRSKNEFFDYEAKYTKGMADEITPAPIDKAIFEKVQQISSFLYDEIGCQGIVRFDYIFNENGIYFLEGNTVPGMSEASIVPQQAADYGIDLSRFFSMLIEDMFYRIKN